MLDAMSRKRRPLLSSLAVAMLAFGLAAPAFADIGPRPPRENKKVEIEPHRAPPMTPPPEAAPPEPAQPEVPAEAETPPETEPEAKAEIKTETETKPDSKKAEDSKTSGCSIEDDSERNILGLAALVLLISGASLRRRRRA